MWNRTENFSPFYSLCQPFLPSGFAKCYVLAMWQLFFFGSLFKLNFWPFFRWQIPYLTFSIQLLRRRYLHNHLISHKFWRQTSMTHNLLLLIIKTFSRCFSSILSWLCRQNTKELSSHNEWNFFHFDFRISASYRINRIKTLKIPLFNTHRKLHLDFLQLILSFVIHFLETHGVCDNISMSIILSTRSFRGYSMNCEKSKCFNTTGK